MKKKCDLFIVIFRREIAAAADLAKLLTLRAVERGCASERQQLERILVGEDSRLVARWSALKLVLLIADVSIIEIAV